MELWWQKYPGRLEFERRLLEESGISCVLDQEAFARGVAVLNLRADLPDLGSQLLRVTFPSQYPLQPFEIDAPEISLDHHQNPFDKNLCLLSDPGSQWKSSNTVLEFIQTQVPKAIVAGLSSEKNELEAPRGEPASNYFQSTNDSIILYDSAWSIPSDVNSGTLLIGYNEQVSPQQFRGAVLEIRGPGKTVLAEASEGVRASYSLSYSHRAIGRWIRLNAPPRSHNVHEIFKEICEVNKSLFNPDKKNTKPHGIDIVGILFPEETRWRGFGDGWLFLCREGSNPRKHLMLAKGGRAGRIDLNGRNPYLTDLAAKSVAVFGLGCLGAPSVIEFAKCGVGDLRLLDGDTVEAGTIVRWPFGLQTAAGRDKAKFLTFLIRREYPYTTVSNSFNWRIGNIQSADYELHEGDILDQMYTGADLIFDATATPAVNHVLSTLAAEREIPYIFVSGTPGMWGGRIVRVMPGDSNGCFYCYNLSVMDGTIPRPASAGDATGYVEPLGCAAPTFTGTYFDASEIAMGGVRVAVSTLMDGSEGGYPKTNWDVAVIDLRDDAGNLIPPKWQTFALNKHPECPLCKKI